MTSHDRGGTLVRPDFRGRPCKPETPTPDDSRLRRKVPVPKGLRVRSPGRHTVGVSTPMALWCVVSWNGSSVISSPGSAVVEWGICPRFTSPVYHRRSHARLPPGPSSTSRRPHISPVVGPPVDPLRPLVIR